MRNSYFKESYRGQGIYWFGGSDYGDETQVWANSIRACREIIDARLKAQDEARPDHLKFWDTLSHETRNQWRRLTGTGNLSASELAYADYCSRYCTPDCDHSEH